MPRAPRDSPASIRRVVAAVALQVGPLLALLGVFTTAGAAWWVASGDAVPAHMFGRLTIATVLGLMGSFVVHELAHLVAMRRMPSVREVWLERTPWRLSLHPRGQMTPRQVAGVAVAGPGACTLLGLALWTVVPGTALHWWYLGHLVALVPPLGDGRALVTAIRSTRRRERPTARRV